MATVTRENIGTLHDKVTVKLTKEDYLPNFEKTLKQYAKTANVPGFRKGMVPAGMLRKMYGPSIFNEEVIRSAGKKLEDYMQAEKLAIFAQPMILPNPEQKRLDINQPTDVDFSFEIGLKPEFEIPALKNKQPITLYKIAIGDKLMDDEIERIKRRSGKVESIDTVNSKEDILYCTIEACDGEGNVIPNSKTEETIVMDKMPAKMQEKLMGKSTNETFNFRPVDVCSAEELPVFMNLIKKDEAAAEYTFKFHLSKIGTLVPVELGPELYAQVFPNTEVADEADFRAKVKAELSKEFDRIALERMQNEMYELLVHNTPITLPVPFLKRWMMEGGEKPKSAQEVEMEFSSFEHQLRWQLISDKIIIENGINVSREEVMADIKARVLSYFGMAGEDGEEAPWMDSYITKLEKDNKMTDETFRRLLTDKIFSFLTTQFSIEQKDTDEEAFFKLADPHAMHHHH